MMLSKNEWTCEHCGAVVPTGILNVAKHTVEECPVTARKVVFDGKPITKEEFEKALEEIFSPENHERMLKERQEYYNQMFERAKMMFGKQWTEAFEAFVEGKD